MVVGKIDKKEKERRMRYVRIRAVVLKNLIINLEKNTGIDMRDDVIAFFQDRFEKAYE